MKLKQIRGNLYAFRACLSRKFACLSDRCLTVSEQQTWQLNSTRSYLSSFCKFEKPALSWSFMEMMPLFGVAVRALKEILRSFFRLSSWACCFQNSLSVELSTTFFGSHRWSCNYCSITFCRTILEFLRYSALIVTITDSLNSGSTDGSDFKLQVLRWRLHIVSFVMGSFTLNCLDYLWLVGRPKFGIELWRLIFGFRI